MSRGEYEADAFVSKFGHAPAGVTDAAIAAAHLALGTAVLVLLRPPFVLRRDASLSVGAVLTTAGVATALTVCLRNVPPEHIFRGAGTLVVRSFGG